jgi:hypothetical protein
MEGTVEHPCGFRDYGDDRGGAGEFGMVDFKEGIMEKIPVMDIWASKTFKVRTACTTCYLTVLFSDDARKTVVGFIPSIGRSGDCAGVMADTIAGLVELFQGHTVDMRGVAKVLARSQCSKESISAPTCVRAVGTKLLEVIGQE